MTNYPYSAYGPNPYSGNVNADNGWGGYKWPGGVPGNLLTSFGVPAGGGTSRLTFRSELVELVQLSFQIAAKDGYTIWAVRNGEVWGPWSYENRAISGSSTASNHSRGRAWDINAPNNPYHDPLICDMPPAMVQHFEAIGWAWGGRYNGRKDAMHFEFGYAPGDVSRFVAKARAILGGGAVIVPPTQPEDDSMSAAEVKQLSDQITALTNLLFTPDARGPGHEIRPEVAYATKVITGELSDIKTDADKQRDDIAGQVAAVRDRVLNPGARWDNFQDIVARLNLILRALNIPVPEGPVPPAPPAPAGDTYTVKSGDTLGAIAKATGKSVADLVSWNKLANPDAINEGQVLRLGP